MTASARWPMPSSIDLLLDLHARIRVPAVRGAAMRALARVDPDDFLSTLAGLDADATGRCASAQAAALGDAPGRRRAAAPDRACCRTAISAWSRRC